MPTIKNTHQLADKINQMISTDEPLAEVLASKAPQAARSMTLSLFFEQTRAGMPENSKQNQAVNTSSAPRLR